jgi:peroxiredoxin
MRVFVRLALVLLIVLGAAFGAIRLNTPTTHVLAEGSAAPALRLAPLGGGDDVDLASLQGRLVVLNFWATWCPPCVQEMPSLDSLHRALASDGLTVVAVSVDEDPGALRRFVDSKALGLLVLRDPGGRRAWAAYGVEGYPMTFVIGPDGVVRERYDGPTEWDTPGALAHFRELLRATGVRPAHASSPASR